MKKTAVNSSFHQELRCSHLGNFNSLMLRYGNTSFLLVCLEGPIFASQAMVRRLGGCIMAMRNILVLEWWRSDDRWFAIISTWHGRTSINQSNDNNQHMNWNQTKADGVHFGQKVGFKCIQFLMTALQKWFLRATWFVSCMVWWVLKSTTVQILLQCVMFVGCKVVSPLHAKLCLEIPCCFPVGEISYSR